MHFKRRRYFAHVNAGATSRQKVSISQGHLTQREIQRSAQHSTLQMNQNLHGAAYFGAVFPMTTDSILHPPHSSLPCNNRLSTSTNSVVEVQSALTHRAFGNDIFRPFLADAGWGWPAACKISDTTPSKRWLMGEDGAEGPATRRVGVSTESEEINPRLTIQHFIASCGFVRITMNWGVDRDRRDSIHRTNIPTATKHPKYTVPYFVGRGEGGKGRGYPSCERKAAETKIGIYLYIVIYKSSKKHPGFLRLPCFCKTF